MNGEVYPRSSRILVICTMVCTAFARLGGRRIQLNAGSTLPRHQLAKRLNDQLQWRLGLRVVWQ